MDFDRLDELLKKRGISRRKLALAVGIKPGTMSAAFVRQSGLSSEDVLKIAQYLEVSPYYLEGIGEMDSRLEDQVEFNETNTRIIKKTLNEGVDLFFENKMVASFRKLNLVGKLEAVKRVDELTEIARYTVPDEEE